MRERCKAIAAAATPPGYTIYYHKKLDGAACGKLPFGIEPHPRGDYWLLVPRPHTPKSLRVFLHECAHVHLGHCEPTTKSNAEVEAEADAWVKTRMIAGGVPTRARAHSHQWPRHQQDWWSELPDSIREEWKRRITDSWRAFVSAKRQ
jgi:hypothetical protein